MELFTGLVKRVTGTTVIAVLLSVWAIAQSAPPNIGDIKNRATAYKRSGAYDRDLAAVIAKAQKFVEQRGPKVKKPALILDIDETSLSNWPEIQANDFGFISAGPCDGLPAGPCGVRSWELSSR